MKNFAQPKLKRKKGGYPLQIPTAVDSKTLLARVLISRPRFREKE
jgi:hypothetical protein